MITPNALAGSQYYKVGNFITFAWNYTSLSVTPSAIDILATCKKNQAMYTLALNQTVRPTGEIVWDTGSYQASETPQLLTEVYTLIIHDAAKDTTAAPQAGYLATFNTFQFAMYSPQIYTPLADGIQCATCSGALSAMERQTLSFLFGMGALTVLSFMWFAGGWGLLY
ncbi:hypothetical protein LTR04_006751 [Oleoguttula sp. CCFEE 6159]|nr:hypothetical protein LTR04_006751 [Oleoguttula sp. CCFEE 6159]